MVRSPYAGVLVGVDAAEGESRLVTVVEKSPVRRRLGARSPVGVDGDDLAVFCVVEAEARCIN